ncbi:hypothetical protein FB45DRAFT_394216 [Roridomyces roridus]|uniref:TPR-like protein n=1 Tax=Roridomyces roridus TaxID=1738132 RepID=A0AAD7B1I2_9AGAR|nr:hypothetical protein FB45DRAFT_394216 [Roridomyces roridus]
MYMVSSGTGGPGGVGDQHGGEGGPGEGGTLIYGSYINNLNVYPHGQEPRQQGQIEPITQEQCHTTLALVRCTPASQIFQGRQEILEKMQTYFSQEPKKRRIFVLHGLGGSGKTQVALKFLESTNDLTKCFFVNASSPEALKTSFMNLAISQRFGRTAEAGVQWLISEHKAWTLLFDNADNPRLKLWPFFPQCTHGNIIITSRNPQLAAYSPGAHSHVGDLDEADTIELLLARAVKKHTDENHKLAVPILQELSCLPLAIVQAGAYIAKFKCLLNYLSIYRQNKAELLRQHPDQTLDDYEWTVYTTWQISFEKLSPIAAYFLQLCALLHHSSIPESIFANATKWMLNSEGNETESMQAAREFLQNFVSSSGGWQEQNLRNIVAEIEEYSLFKSDETSKMLSMHPLVHLWCSDTQCNQATVRECMTNILGMAIDLGPDAYLERISMIVHVNALVPDFTTVNCQFWSQYAWIYYDGGKFEQAKDLYELNLERQRELLGKDHPDTLTAMANVAVTYGQLGRYQEAERLEPLVLKQRQKLLGYHHPETLRSMASLSTIYWQLGRYQEAEPLDLSVLKHRQKLLGDDHPDTLTAMASLAFTYGQLGRYQEAEPLQLSALKQLQKLFGDDHTHTLTVKANLAATNGQLGRYQEVELLQVSVVERRQRLLGNDHPHTLTVMASLATTYGQLERYQDAEPLEPSVLEQRQKLLGNDHPDTLNAMANLAATYWELGRYHEAEPLQLSVLERGQRVLGDNHHDTLFAMSNLAATYAQLGRYPEAQPLQASGLKQRQKLLGNDHPDTLAAMANLARTFYRTGRNQTAQNLQLEVLAKRRKVLGPDHPHTLLSIKVLKDTQDALTNTEDDIGLGVPGDIQEHSQKTGLKRLSRLLPRFKLLSSRK